MRRIMMSRLIWIYAVCKSLLLSPVAVKKLKDLHTQYILPLLTRETIVVKSCLLSCKSWPFWTRIYDKSPNGSKLFPLMVDPISWFPISGFSLWIVFCLVITNSSLRVPLCVNLNWSVHVCGFVLVLCFPAYVSPVQYFRILSERNLKWPIEYKILYGF